MKQVVHVELRPAFCALTLAFALIGVAPAAAGDLTVKVTGQGAPLQNAVVAIYPASAPPAARLVPQAMDQRNLQFQPHVLVVQVGTEVRFPNSDNTRHQVYSFSPAKSFDLPLYSGSRAKPILLDKAGVVELGCNIHDWMLGYIVVLDTPYFGITDTNGQFTLQAPAGSYRLEVWHEQQRAPTSQRASQPVRLNNTTSSLSIDIPVKPSPQGKEPVDDRLRELQKKFRNLKRDS